MRLREDGFCRICGARLAAGTYAHSDRSTGFITCTTCNGKSASNAGASAQREYERRRATDEQRLRTHWGPLGGVAVLLAPERPSTESWKRGAAGERRLGTLLDTLGAQGISVLHDRRIPRSRANIDHIVVTRGGVVVVDAKHYKGRPDVERRGGLLRPRTDHLMVGRRDCSELLDGIARQVECVRQITGDVPVVGSLCFVDSDWPLLRDALTARGIVIAPPRRLLQLIRKSSRGHLPVAQLAATLDARLPPA